jgi:hypothetical protein
LDPTRELSLPTNGGDFYNVTRTSEELSVVCTEDLAPAEATVERGWSGLVVEGQLDFSLTGILSAIAEPLARAGIPIFAVSTYDTDYVFRRLIDTPMPLPHWSRPATRFTLTSLDSVRDT